MAAAVDKSKVYRLSIRIVMTGDLGADVKQSLCTFGADITIAVP